MNEGPHPDPEAVTAIKMFGLCETFGWTLEELGIKPEEKPFIMNEFLLILRERNAKQEMEMRKAQMRK